MLNLRTSGPPRIQLIDSGRTWERALQQTTKVPGHRNSQALPWETLSQRMRVLCSPLMWKSEIIKSSSGLTVADHSPGTLSSHRRGLLKLERTLANSG